MILRAALAALGLAGIASPAVGYGPETLYTLHCQGCHLADGSGSPGKVPALGSQLGRLAGTPEGRAYLVRVPGVANAPIGDADLAALLVFTLRRFDGAGVPRDFVAYRATEIARLRRAPLVDVARERARVLGSEETIRTHSPPAPILRGQSFSR